MSIYKNEVFCIYGQNLSGKSSIIDLLCGRSDLTFGKMKVLNKDINEIASKISVCP